MQEDITQAFQNAQKEGYISFEEEYIIYHTKKPSKQPYNSPEEKIRAKTFIKLIEEKKYPLETLAIEVPVKRGSENKSNKRADIIIYKDKNHKKASIIIECKKQDQRDLKEAKEQALSYANFLRADYAQATNGKESVTLYIKDDGNDLIDDIPNYGGDAPLWKYLRDSKDNNILSTTTEELKSLLQKIHDYLWNGGKRNPAEAFSEFSKIIFTKIMDEKIAEYDADYDKEYYEFQKNRDEDKYGLEKRIKGLYNRYKEKDKNVFDNSLILDADEIKFLVDKLEAINFSKTELDIKGQVFQKFFADFFKGTAGQYFTPLNIVRFIVQCFDIKQDDLVLDPSCGSGGFLLQVLQYMQEKSKNIKNEIARHSYWHSFAEKNLYGIEISGGISQTAKMNMIIHDDGHTNVITADGLDIFENFIKKNNKFQKNSFDYIFTNPPFGSSIPSTKSYFEHFSFSESEVHFIDKIIDKKSSKELSNQKSEILFLERYFEFLKEGGIVASVLPDGILTNSSTQNVRDYLLERFYLLASFSLPQHTFSNYGAGVKSSILILRKKSKKDFDKFITQKESIELKITNANKNEILGLRAELKEHLAPLNKEQKRLEKELKNDVEESIKENINKELEILKGKVQDFKESYKLKEEIIRDKIKSEVKERVSQIESYKVFMTIIENIGYDATGKETCKYEESDLYKVSQEFKAFYKENWKTKQ